MLHDFIIGQRIGILELNTCVVGKFLFLKTKTHVDYFKKPQRKDPIKLSIIALCHNLKIALLRIGFEKHS